MENIFYDKEILISFYLYYVFFIKNRGYCQTGNRKFKGLFKFGSPYICKTKTLLKVFENYNKINILESFLAF